MRNIVTAFKDKKILLVGDAIIDMYIHGRVSGQALGASVPRVLEERSTHTFGGNGLVAANMLELGGTVYFVSVIGADEDAKLYDALKHSKLKKFFFTDASRRTTVKKRVFGDGVRLLHLNKVDNHGISKPLEKKIVKQIASLMPKVDKVVIMDPQHGLMTRGLIETIKNLSGKYQKPLYVDAQVSHKNSNHHYYKGADTMILNEKEAKAADPRFDTNNAESSMRDLRKKFKLQNVIVKLGESGSMGLFGNHFIQTPGYKVKAVDAWGAGDAFLAAYALGDTTHLEEALRLANMWAGLSTTVAGTTPPKKKDLVKALKVRHAKVK